MTKVDEHFQFVPPHLHRQNAAERAIQTFKNYFIYGISSVNKYPPHEYFVPIDSTGMPNVEFTSKIKNQP